VTVDSDTVNSNTVNSDPVDSDTVNTDRSAVSLLGLSARNEKKETVILVMTGLSEGKLASRKYGKQQGRQSKIKSVLPHLPLHNAVLRTY
jgi:hypothetical protein